MENISTNWKNIIEKYPKLNEIFDFLQQERIDFRDTLEIYPQEDKIFKSFNFFDIEKTKVVILGQDPYHGPNQATGLSFAVSNKNKTPPSLRNIQNELVYDIGVDLLSKNLEHWAKQGVLLLNSALTVRQKTPASHMKIWLPFTKFIIDYLNNTCHGIVFVAWGAFAYDKLKDIDLSKHKLIVSSHPSPLSASRKYRDFPSFKGSKPFSKINSFLKDKIVW